MNISFRETGEYLKVFMSKIKEYVFPLYSDVEPHKALWHIADSLEALAGKEIAETFAQEMPEIKRLLEGDVQAIMKNDPAAKTDKEVIFCYPAVTAMLHYRTAHVLLRLGVPVIPRMLTGHAHSVTGIDIHPAAQIGEGFAIDHGTGIVIGETSIIGNNVTLYQGVTLGAKNIRRDPDGNPANLPRHPILEDGVTVYSNASILGRITIGENSVIGGNVWLTHSVKKNSRILQGKTQEVFSDGGGI